MIFSVSSLFITLIVSTVLILLFYLILFNNKLIFLFRVDLLIVLSLIIILRLFLPFEWPFTITILFPTLMNPIFDFYTYKLVNNFTVLYLLIFIWIIGSIIQTIRFIIQFKKISNIFNILKQTAEKKKLSDFLTIEEKINYPVWIDNEIPCPMILGFKKIILLPKMNLQSKELDFVLFHELNHLKHHDNWIKLITNILLILYWWFPPVYLLCNKIHLVLEMRADKHAIKTLSKLEVADYAKTLTKIQKSISNQQSSIFNNLMISSKFYIEDNSYTLLFRVKYLFNRHYGKRSNVLLIALIVFLPLLSYGVVFEPYFKPPVEGEDYFYASDFERGFLVYHKDGTYTMHIDDKILELGKIDPKEDLAFKDVPIIEE
ncbi:M56 family metallopeptidase [Erysipelotrichaceae bacterium LKV-178-WT-2G]|uniref:M56 family metallopeptidase n=1 Tax=Floccifex porci TaxID=2606629 RepID=A0A7X2N3U1_9FIRM|nr:M56 family metallopeptidase [Floccifex porci]